MSTIADFSDEQVASLQTKLDKHFGKRVELHQADSEIAPEPDSTEMVVCPVVVWQAADCQFALLRAGEARYRAQFFCQAGDMQTTPQAEFNTLEDCLDALLRAQKAWVDKTYAQINEQLNEQAKRV